MKDIILKSTLGISIIVFGALVANAIKYHKDFNRVVRVKGLAQKKVKSDKAIWHITIENDSFKRKEQYLTLREHKNILKDFLISKGIKEEDINFENIMIQKKYIPIDKKRGLKELKKFTGKMKITVSSDNVDMIAKISNNIDDLILKGITVSYSDTYYLYTQLNSIKEQMLKEATINARKAAQSFAQNAQSKVGAIQTANQGYFEIKDSGTIDNWSQNKTIFKKVRVVSNISFFLN